MVIRNAVPLFNGEVVVSPSGIYTFVHYYEHPVTSRKVVMVGMDHAGDEEYFARVKQILIACDLVLFEDIRKEQRQQRERDAEEEEMRKVFSEANPDEAFFVAMQLYFLNVQKILSPQDEGEAFDAEYNQPHWFSGDTMLLTEAQEQEYLEALTKGLQIISSSRKQEVVDYVKKALEKMERGCFTRRDLGRGFVFFYSDPLMAQIILENLAKPRDLHCFSEFDRLLQERSPQTIGIKFGAGHISFQRQLLEERGYIHQKSKKLRNMSFARS